MSALYLVSCVSQKQTDGRRHAARDLYTSDWFIKARAYVEKQSAPWYILSAKYGLLHPEAPVEAYEVTLNRMKIDQRRKWARLVISALDASGALDGTRTVVLLAGDAYREFLEPVLVAVVPRVEVPMRGLGIGQQKAWLLAQVQAR